MSHSSVNPSDLSTRAKRSNAPCDSKAKSTSFVESLIPSSVSDVPPWAIARVSTSRRGLTSRSNQPRRSAEVFSRIGSVATAIQALHVFHERRGDRVLYPPHSGEGRRLRLY